MNQTKSRILSLMLAFVLVLSLFAGITPVQAEAATNQYSYNTGTRHETCTSLTEQAKSYYSTYITNSSTYTDMTWDQVLALTSSSDSCLNRGGDSDELYNILHTLMDGTNKKNVSYNGTSDGLQKYWPYTDCDSNSSTYLFFYSDCNGDSTMNREHVWPKSHATFYQSNGGSDLHHLRPANSTINSTRNNYTMGNVQSVLSTYKTSSNGSETILWYSPTDYLVEVRDDIKGDVARILLYVWCCWAEPNLFENSSATGSGNNASDGIKVIESLNTLLQWMKDDPVDTWEMSRNDVVESIQGNRNVFIDYPELAWQLFGKEIPTNMTTPSGYAVNSACNHEHAEADTGTHYNATCTEAAYTLYTCTKGNHTYKVYDAGSTKLNHDLDNGTTVAATCTTKGYTRYTCQRTGCGYTEKRNETDYAHSFSNGVCTNCKIMNELFDGAEIVIVSQSHGKALSVTASNTYYKVGVDFTTLSSVSSTEKWSVTANDDGSYTFSNGTSQLKKSVGYASFNDASTQNKWSLNQKDSTSTEFYLANTVDTAYQITFDSTYGTWAVKSNITDGSDVLCFYFVGTDIPSNECDHSSYTTVEAVTATCTTAGHVKYYQCNSCKKYNTDLTNADGWNSTKPAEAKDSTNHTGEKIWALKDSTGHQQTYGCCGANASEKAAHTYGTGDNSNTCTICGYVTSTGTSTSSSYFEKVTTAPTDWSGTYLIVYEGTPVALNGVTKKSNKYIGTYESVSIASGKLTNATQSMYVTIEKADDNYYYIKLGALYLGLIKNNSELYTSASPSSDYKNSISFDSSGNVVITNSTHNEYSLYYNKNNNQQRFCFYKASSNQQPIQLYKLVCTHSLLQEKVADDYLKSAATCGSAAVYYKSCESCGEKSTETFTVGQPTGNHTLTHHDAVSATCTHVGNIEYWDCSVCNGYFKDANGTQVSEITEVTLATINHVLTHHEAKAATCTEKGNAEYWQCNSCKAYFNSETADNSVEWSTLEIPVDSSNHDYVSVPGVAATCCTTGTKEHYKCSMCKKLFVKGEGDTYTETTLDALTIAKDAANHASEKTHLVDLKNGKHQNIHDCCGAPAGDAVDHTFGEDNKCACGATNHTTTFVAAKEATCTEDGNIAYWYCSHCDKNFEDENATIEITGSVILPKGHTLVIDFAKTATCTTAGRTSGAHCLRCDYKSGGQVIPALGHVWGKETVNKAATCTENGSVTKTCSVCDLTVNETIVAKGHTEVIDAAKAATCTESGLTEGKHCSVCNTVFVKQETVAALGHKWDNGQQTAAATCTTDGTKTFTCSACKLTREETIAALGHKWDNGQQTAAATCTTDGTKTFTCSSCLETRTEKIAASGSHTFGDWHKSAKGEERRICSACGEKETRAVEESSSVTTIVIIVAAVAVLGGAAAAAYVFLFKKKAL